MRWRSLCELAPAYEKVCCHTIARYGAAEIAARGNRWGDMYIEADCQHVVKCIIRLRQHFPAAAMKDMNSQSPKIQAAGSEFVHTSNL